MLPWCDVILKFFYILSLSFLLPITSSFPNFSLLTPPIPNLLVILPHRKRVQTAGRGRWPSQNSVSAYRLRRRQNNSRVSVWCYSGVFVCVCVLQCYPPLTSSPPTQTKPTFSSSFSFCRKMGGTLAPEGWKGGLEGVQYNLGPELLGNYKLRLATHNSLSRRRSYNVIGSITGSVEPGEWEKL